VEALTSLAAPADPVALAHHGLASYVEALADVVRESGGAVRTDAEVTKILVEGGRVTGILV
jgi:phytoene dehydrogenase-like protein